MKLKGSTVIVTGASRGIGRETARQLAQAGSNVVLASRDERKGALQHWRSQWHTGAVGLTSNTSGTA